MKTYKHDLDIDHIGGEEKLTKVEEEALEEYFRTNKSREKSTSIPLKTEKVLK